MIQTEFADIDLLVRVDLDPPAQAATVKYTLRDNTGTPISGFVNLTIENEDEAEFVAIEVPAAQNAKTLATENRFLSVSWENNGVRYTTQKNYRLIDFIPFVAVPSDVRTLLGLNTAELDDSEIDLYQAANDLKTAFPAFITNLTSGTTMADQMNRLIVLRAALDLLPSLSLRIAQSMGVEGTRFTRLQNLDIASIQRDILNEYNGLTGEDTGSPVVFVLSPPPTDQFPG